MNYFRAKNYRGFEDTGEIKINPITIFVGANSSGKSSILRSFPLFKQSCIQKVDGPILWYGQYVDFDSFENVVSNNKNKDELIFEFSFPLKKNKNENNNDIIIKVTINKNDENLAIKRVKLLFLDFEIYYKIKNNRVYDLTINGFNIESDKIELVYITNNIIPIFLFISKKEKNKKFELINGKNKYFYYFLSGEKENIYLKKALKEVRKKLKDQRIADKTIEGILDSVNIGNIENMINQLKENGADKTTWENFINSNLDNYKYFKKICCYIFLNKLPMITKILSSNFSNYYENIYYIAPVRATAERYYRIANYSIDEIDQSGMNLALYLNSMKNNNNMNKFQEWTNEKFGFSPEIETNEGHLSININTKNQITNLADTGFGYSQILPIILQLWILSNKSSLSRRRFFSEDEDLRTLVIEQPELHLHPKLQARLVNAFIEALDLAERNNIDLRIIFETHSKSIIDAIGQSIEKEKIDHNDVKIYLTNNEKSNSTIRSSYFNKKGYLKDWPFGFFDSEV